MTEAKIAIEKCIQDVQHSGIPQDPAIMYSQIFFSLRVGDTIYRDLSVQISQEYGSSYLSEPILLGPIQGYDGPINIKSFRAAIEKYYHLMLNERASITSLEKDVLRTRNNTYNFKEEFTIEVTREDSN